jgi:hypothetical protein
LVDRGDGWDAVQVALPIEIGQSGGSGQVPGGAGGKKQGGVSPQMFGSADRRERTA